MTRKVRHLTRRAALAALLPAASLPLPAASAVIEVHGASDAFAEPGLALAWGVLRGRDEAAAEVHIRIEADSRMHARVSLIGRDAFGPDSRQWLPPTPVSGLPDVVIERRHFADFPRTELHLTPAVAGAPQRLIFFVGVPDTTPEFTDRAALAADLARRIDRARDRLR